MHDYAAYVQVDNAVAKLQRWWEQGAQIDYLSSRRDADDVAKDAPVLQNHGFPSGAVLARQPGESYSELTERVMPHVLIEDDWREHRRRGNEVSADTTEPPRSHPFDHRA